MLTEILFILMYPALFILLGIGVLAVADYAIRREDDEDNKRDC